MAYMVMVSRKKINKSVSKSIKSLINFGKSISLPHLNEDSDLVAIVNMLRKVLAATFSVLKSLLSHVSEIKETSKHRPEWMVESFQIHATKTWFVRPKKTLKAMMSRELTRL